MLYLTPNVYLCALDESVVFLDLKRNQYLTVPSSTLTSLRYSVAGFSSVLPSGHRPGASDMPAVGDLEELVATGLLTPLATCGKPASPPALESASTALAPGLRRASGVRDGRALKRLLLAYSYVSLNMRAGRIHTIVTHLHASAMRHVPHRVDDPNDVLLPLLGSFRHYRTFLYTAHNVCLFNGLVLACFLHYYGLAPTFVIGVRVKPFFAHAWVQVANIVVDDRLEYVQRFTPILAA